MPPIELDYHELRVNDGNRSWRTSSIEDDAVATGAAGMVVERKQKRLGTAGWKVGDYASFLGLTREEVEFIEFRAALSDGLKEMRARLGLSQAEVATRVGSSQSRVAKMEAADPSVSIDLLVRSLLGLGATRGELGRLMSRRRLRPTRRSGTSGAG